MFGISFSELLLVGLVALLVLGPERLPGAARTAGLWVGRLKRSFNAIKQEVEREIGADEIRRQLHNEHILSLEQEARKIFSPPQQQPTPESSPWRRRRLCSMRLSLNLRLCKLRLSQRRRSPPLHLRLRPLRRPLMTQHCRREPHERSS